VVGPSPTPFFPGPSSVRAPPEVEPEEEGKAEDAGEGEGELDGGPGFFDGLAPRWRTALRAIPLPPDYPHLGPRIGYCR